MTLDPKIFYWFYFLLICECLCQACIKYVQWDYPSWSTRGFQNCQIFVFIIINSVTDCMTQKNYHTSDLDLIIPIPLYYRCFKPILCYTLLEGMVNYFTDLVLFLPYQVSSFVTSQLIIKLISELFTLVAFCQTMLNRVNTINPVCTTMQPNGVINCRAICLILTCVVDKFSHSCRCLSI